MNGKAIYQPKGAAAEYAKYACNFYIGCSNECSYCYCKRFNWGNVPKLKKCFKSELHALEVFEKELNANLSKLQKHGLFFSFTTDPLLRICANITFRAILIANYYEVPCKILTKRAEWVSHLEDYLDEKEVEDGVKEIFSKERFKKLVAFGFTLTGRDDLEPNASTNAERIEAMKKLYDAGFKTWCSVEPIIDFESSFSMIYATKNFCNLYKIGLKSGQKFEIIEIRKFIQYVTDLLHYNSFAKIYFKDSLLQQAGIKREDLPSNCVSRDYNLFNDKNNENDKGRE